MEEGAGNGVGHFVIILRRRNIRFPEKKIADPKTKPSLSNVMDILQHCPWKITNSNPDFELMRE